MIYFAIRTEICLHVPLNLRIEFFVVSANPRNLSADVGRELLKPKVQTGGDTTDEIISVGSVQKT